MFGGDRKESLLTRLGPKQSVEALPEPYASESEIKDRGTVKGWVVVGLDGVENDEFEDWIRQAVKFLGELPTKKA